MQSIRCIAAVARSRLRNRSDSFHTVVMIRHGESVWNLEKRFTGWCDIPLTKRGESDATDAGSLMGERGMKFDVAFTSDLERAWRTCAIVLAESGQSGVEVINSSSLNERHYGALQGHLKDCPELTKAFGEDKLIEWRRSFHTEPPSLYDSEVVDKIGPDSLITCTAQMNSKYIDMQKYQEALILHGDQDTNDFVAPDASDFTLSVENLDPFYEFPYPSTESLQQCQERAYGYWKETILPRVRSGERVLIVAHANTIRALVKAVDNIEDDQISHLKIPNGIPLVYTFDDNLQPIVDVTDNIGFQGKYLVSAGNHKQVMQYERCVRKKLRSLFEYLDADRDGKITPDCIIRGLGRLQTYESVVERPVNRIEKTDENAIRGRKSLYYRMDDIDGKDVNDPFAILKENQLHTDICEYEVEELIRCVPLGDENGYITLNSFLRSEENLLPHLTKLRLLQ